MKKNGRPLKFTDVEKMQERIDEYFESVTYTNDAGKVISEPTVTGIALALDMTRESFRNYEKKDKFFATVKKAKQRVEIALESKLYTAQVAGSIFNLKNNFGWKDKTEVEQSGEVKVIGLSGRF